MHMYRVELYINRNVRFCTLQLPHLRLGASLCPAGSAGTAFAFFSLSASRTWRRVETAGQPSAFFSHFSQAELAVGNGRRPRALQMQRASEQKGQTTTPTVDSLKEE